VTLVIVLTVAPARMENIIASLYSARLWVMKD